MFSSKKGRLKAVACNIFVNIEGSLKNFVNPVVTTKAVSEI